MIRRPQVSEIYRARSERMLQARIIRKLSELWTLPFRARAWPMRRVWGSQRPAGDRQLMNRIILADNQAIFRAGAARVLALEDDMRIVAQCEDVPALRRARGTARLDRPLFAPACSSTLRPSLARSQAAAAAPSWSQKTLNSPRRARCACSTASSAATSPAPILVDCVRRVARGQRFMQHANVTTMQAPTASEPASATG